MDTEIERKQVTTAMFLPQERKKVSVIFLSRCNLQKIEGKITIKNELKTSFSVDSSKFA